MTSLRGRSGVLLLAMLMSAGQVTAANDDVADRARITAERAAVEARFAEREHECASRFVVTACVEDARREQRAALASLRQQQTLLDEAQRKQRAAERLDRLSKPRGSAAQQPASSAKREAHEARQSRQARAARAAPPPNEASLAASGPERKPSQTARPLKGGAPSAPLDPVNRQTREAARQADSASRTQAAQAHRSAVEQRQAERLKKGRVTHPLPVPASAATP